MNKGIVLYIFDLFCHAEYPMSCHADLIMIVQIRMYLMSIQIRFS